MASTFANFARLVGHQARQVALGIGPVEVDRGVAQSVVEGGQVAGQLQAPGRAHRVADEALGVVEQGVAAVLAPHPPQGLALLGVAGGGARGVRADDVDVLGADPRPTQAPSGCTRPGDPGSGRTKSVASLFMA